MLFQLAVAFIVLLAATYTDLRERVIPDWLTLGTIAAFLPIDLYLYGWFSLVHVIATFIVSYLLYKIGVWAGGDVKLFTALDAIYPRSVMLFGYSAPFVLWLFIAAILFGLLVTLVLLLKRVFSDPVLRRDFFNAVLLAARKSFVLAVFAPFFGWAAIFVTFIPFPFDFFASVTLLPFVSISVALKGFVYVFAGSLIFVVLAFRTSAFVREKSVDELREGDIVADFVLDDGTVIPFSWQSALQLFKDSRVRLSPLRAAGLYEDDIRWLRSVGIRHMRVKYSLPFVPFVLVGYLFILAALYL